MHSREPRAIFVIQQALPEVRNVVLQFLSLLCNFDVRFDAHPKHYMINFVDLLREHLILRLKTL
jgi:hypothetical protein